MTDSKEIKVKEKQELTTPAEQTVPGPTFTPEVDIFETEKTITLLADIPGVKSDKLNIDLRDNILTIIGDIEPAEGADEEDVVIESYSQQTNAVFNYGTSWTVEGYVQAQLARKQ